MLVIKRNSDLSKFELMRADANLNASTEKRLSKKKMSAIMKNDDLSVISDLIKAGADVNYKNEYGCTPLRLAKRSGNAAIISFLKENGAR